MRTTPSSPAVPLLALPLLLLTAPVAGDRPLRAQLARPAAPPASVDALRDDVSGSEVAWYGTAAVATFATLEVWRELDASVSRELATGGAGDWETVVRRAGSEMGRNYPGIVLGATPLLVGALTGDDGLVDQGIHTLAAFYVACGITAMGKFVVGRRRPGRSSHPATFERFNDAAGYHSFPSGHATRAFVVAAILSAEVGHRPGWGWVPYAAYPMAGWTAGTRVLDGAHWPTDVVAGAAVGIFSARLVEWLAHSRDEGGPGASIHATVLPGGVPGVGIALPAP